MQPETRNGGIFTGDINTVKHQRAVSVQSSFWGRWQQKHSPWGNSCDKVSRIYCPRVSRRTGILHPSIIFSSWIILLVWNLLLATQNTDRHNLSHILAISLLNSFADTFSLLCMGLYFWFACQMKANTHKAIISDNADIGRFYHRRKFSWTASSQSRAT